MGAKSPTLLRPGSMGPSVTPRIRLPANCDPPPENGPTKQAVWVVFGASGHMGRSLVRAALSHGDKVTAVGHTAENTKEEMSGWHKLCSGMLCDVRLRESVEHVLQTAIREWGKIDIIANCTGYGVVAAAEDQSWHDVMNQFATNFMGTLHIIQQSLPYFRENAIPGRYLIFSSTSGALGVPGLAPYCATKYAVEGLIESMLYETDCFNIKATLVEPGHVRQDDPDEVSHAAESPNTASLLPISHNEIYPQVSNEKRDTAQARTLQSSSSSDQPIYRRRYGHFFIKPAPSAPYSSPHSPAGHAKRTFQWLNMRQPTSVVRSAELLWQLGHCAYPPLRLVLGSYAVESIRDRLKSITEEIEDWKWLNFAPGTLYGDDDRDGVGERRSHEDISDHSEEEEDEHDGDDEDDEDEDAEMQTEEYTNDPDQGSDTMEMDE